MHIQLHIEAICIEMSCLPSQILHFEKQATAANVNDRDMQYFFGTVLTLDIKMCSILTVF